MKKKSVDSERLQQIRSNDKPVRSQDDFLVFGSPKLGESEIDEVIACLRSGWLGTGPRVALFEKKFSDFKHVHHVAAVNSCTAALHLSMLAAGIGPGDEVITTPLTFCATVNAIIHTGATPVLVDVDPTTMNIDPAAIESKVGRKTKAILPVHFAGRPCDMSALVELAQANGLKLIEDCAHAVESKYHGRTMGSFGDFGCFSFYVTKNIVTGEGGMVVAKQSSDISRVKTLALHGMTKDAWNRFGDAGYKHYGVVEAGFKYNMMDIQAAIGIHQLDKIELFWSVREKIWNRYQDAFQSLPITLPASIEPNTKHAFHLYNILVDKQRCGVTRDEFLELMTGENIGVGVHYLSIPEHPYYKERFGWDPNDFPSATRIGRQTVSLPISPKLTHSDVSDVIEAVFRSLGRKNNKKDSVR